MARRFILHAPNVHQGGGATLLRGLLSNVSPPATLILDSRLWADALTRPGIELHRVRPTLPQRIAAERLRARLADDTTHTLCFAGLPPLFRGRGRVSVFVQNRNIVSRTDISGYPWRQRLRIEIERMWFRMRLANADEFVVQTETMRDLLRPLVGNDRIRVQPFVPPGEAASLPAFPRIGGQQVSERLLALTPPVQGSRYEFCYVSTGEPHKNHRRLVEAWVLLAKVGIFPSLCLTVSREHCPSLSAFIDAQTRRYGLRIDNVGYVSWAEVDAIYRHSDRLIYPSLYESFGLPLVEANALGLPILAAERDYVRDLVCPAQTFDPDSPRSIARAVERALKKPESPLSIATPQAFLEQLLAA